MAGTPAPPATVGKGPRLTPLAPIATEKGDRTFSPEVSSAMILLDSQIRDLTTEYLRKLKTLEDMQSRVTLAARTGASPDHPPPQPSLSGLAPVPPVPVTVETIANIATNPISESWKASRLIGGRAAPDSETIRQVAINFQRVTVEELDKLAIGALTKEIDTLKDRAKELRGFKTNFENKIKDEEALIRDRMRTFTQAVQSLASLNAGRPAAAGVNEVLSDLQTTWLSGTISGQTLDTAMDRTADRLRRAIDTFNSAHAAVVTPPAPDVASHELAAALAKIVNLESNLTAASAIVDATKLQLAEREATITTLTTSNNELRQQVETLTREKDELTKKLEDCHNENHRKDSEISKLKTEATTSLQTISDARTELDAQRALVAKLNADIVKERTDYDKALKTRQTERDNLSRRYVLLRAAVSLSQNNVANAKEVANLARDSRNNATTEEVLAFITDFENSKTDTQRLTVIDRMISASNDNAKQLGRGPDAGDRKSDSDSDPSKRRKPAPQGPSPMNTNAKLPEVTDTKETTPQPEDAEEEERSAPPATIEGKDDSADG